MSPTGLSMNESPIVHIALATYPYNQSKAFIKALSSKEEDEKGKVGFYQEYKLGIAKYISNIKNELYNPGIYHLFGNYDVAFISLIDNYKFAQKLFVPDCVEEAEFNPNSFQIITGICLAMSENFNPSTTHRYTSICNLKLNNGLLIGNGQKYINAVKNLIIETIGNSVDYAIVQSFSWAEICLVIFSDNVDAIPVITTNLRSKRVKHLDIDDASRVSESLINNSLYKQTYDTKKDPRPNYEFMESHIFSDTHSYFGMKFSDFQGEKNLPDVLKTETEWMIKPGHLGDLRKALKELKIEGNNIFDEEAYFINGKTDYMIPENSKIDKDHIKYNQELFRKLIEPGENGGPNIINKNVRKVKTRVFFKIEDTDILDGDGVTETLTIAKAYKDLVIKNEDIKLLSDYLEGMKVSRQLRDKTLKVFSNFNTGIQDPILFPFFLDFHPFLKKLKEVIEDFHKRHKDYIKEPSIENRQKAYFRVSTLEKYLNKYINIFEEGYQIRMLNSYMFEEINDFDIDFNSSIQQLLTTYNTFVYQIAQTFDTFKVDKYAPVISLNLRNTVANYLSINYNVYHLTAPEFVFSTIIKEIFNSYEETLRNNDVENEKFDKLKNQFYKAIESKVILKDMKENRLIEFERIYIDIVRVIYTYNSNFKLFEYWFWTFNFQNSSLYNIRGSFNEDHFRMELFRLLFVAKVFYPSNFITECPLPEIQTYWDRHYKKLKSCIDDIFSSTNNSLSSQFLTLKTDWEKQISKSLIKEEEEDNQDNDETKASQRLAIKRKTLEDFYRERKSKLRSGEPLLFEETDTTDKLFFINALMYSYLKILYEENGKNMTMLRRNWKDGKPLKSFIQNESWEKHLYNIDPFGGFFFSKAGQASDYNKIQNAMLQSIWHFSQVTKKEYIINQLLTNPTDDK